MSWAAHIGDRNGRDPAASRVPAEAATAATWPKWLLVSGAIGEPRPVRTIWLLLALGLLTGVLLTLLSILDVLGRIEADVRSMRLHTMHAPPEAPK